MLKTTVHTLKDLDKWLSDNFYFEDGHVLAIKENPLEIIVGYNVKANYLQTTLYWQNAGLNL